MPRFLLVACACVLSAPALAPLRSPAEDDDARPFGIDRRVPWTSSRITGSPEPPPPYRTERVFPGLEFKNPTVLTNAPGTPRLFVVELEGKIYSFLPGDENPAAELFADLKQDIEGLRRVYGLTFHPRFAQNRLCYLCYVLEENKEDGTHLSLFTVTRSDPPRLETDSEQVLLTWRSGGHNGGCLKFGPDGYLYVSTGDGAPAFPPDTHDTGQDISDLLASVLRIDVDRAEDGRPYAIPPDNPFVDLDGARGEVWCYGMRNPWKMSFDPATGDLWVGDVGWELWELVYRIERGGNYGWSLREGPQPVHPQRQRGPTPILPPTTKHSHTEARSVTGGFVYRGKRLKGLVGAYVYGDYVTGKMWALRHDGREVTSIEELCDAPFQIICFGVDHDNELYVVGYDGTLHRLVENPTKGPNRDFPKKLSETGLFASVAGHRLAPGVIPYSVNAEPWADGAVAERFVALPGTSQLGVHTEQNVQIGTIKGDWKFPADGVLAKTISLELEPGDPASRRRLETQILHFDGNWWRAYSYHWNNDGTDAALAEGDGYDRAFQIADATAEGGRRQQTWHFASRTECLLCHTTRGGTVYGFKPEQLNRDRDYGAVADNQLRTLAHIGLFEQPLKEGVEPMPDPFDESADLNARARAYLHVNCAHCHRRGGGGTAAIEVPYELKLDKTNLLGARPTQGTFDLFAARVLAPGDPYRSVLYYRMAKLGRGRMPYFGSGLPDRRGLELIHRWISQLDDAGDPPPEAALRLRQREALLLEELREASEPGQRAERIDALLVTTSGALALLRAIEQPEADPALRAAAIRKGVEHAAPQVRDLFERFVPEERRVKRLGTVIRPEQILSLAGDAESGRHLFFEEQGVQCRNCHRIGTQGKSLGPDLDGIAKKNDRAKLLESILQPSKAIDPKFVAYVLETSAGRVHTGLLVRRSDAEVVLRDAQLKEIRVAAEDVEQLQPLQQSLMPELLLRDMTAQQVADLLEFLSGLK